jgi:ATP-dependent helicase HrpB
LTLPSLPVDAVIPELRTLLDAHGAVVLEAPPGTGKTTRVPPALLDMVPGQVWVLEPRRIAARASAARVAAERGEPIGATVGYAVRLERRAGPRTRLLYVTEALLAHRAAEDPDLAGIDAVVLDEFHERGIHADVALALVRALRARRPDLRVVVMSATLDGSALERALGWPRLTVEAVRHPVEIQHVARADARPLEVRVADAVRACAHRGDILVFLPGAGEIARCVEALGRIDRLVVPLHGELDPDTQARALQSADRPRVVLSTNVAETSVTVEGVDTVVDTGLARVSAWDPWTGMGTLAVQPIPRASADQRAGRAGRLGPGLCLRLYPASEPRPAFGTPELQRADLSGTVLDLACMGVTGREELPWLEPPPARAWDSAIALLRRLGALDGTGTVTPLGRAMGRLPLHPRAARMVLEGVAQGVAGPVTTLAAWMDARRRGVETVDPVALALDGAGGLARERRNLEGQLPRGPVPPPAGAERTGAPEEAVARALYVAFPDRVGRRRGSVVVLAEGGRAELDRGFPGGDGIVLVTEAERIEGRVRARACAAIPEAWLLSDAELRTEMVWTGTRVEVTEALCVGAVVLEATPMPGDPGAVAAFLHAHARDVAHRWFPDFEQAEAMVRRVAWLRRSMPEVPALDVDALVRAGCEGCRSLEDLRAVSLVAVARDLLGDMGARLDRVAPVTVDLPGRARVPVTYPEDGGDPCVASRMQDFFGLREGPRGGDGRPLVLHLLAPNRRPVQVTTDLHGFWERHWPSIRKELMRRYPRHRWPEDPRALYVDDGEP